MTADARGFRPRRRMILALGITSALGPLSLDMYLPALPALAADLSVDDTIAQLTLSACLIGLAVGQIVVGALSDRFGRRRLLVGGLLAYAAMSVVCALAPTSGVLIAARAVQGFAGAAGIVLSRAIIRDTSQGRDVARMLSFLVLISGLAPLLAPLLGGQLLRFVDWRGIFAVLAIVGVGIAVLAIAFVPETLPPERRHAGGLRTMAGGFGRVLREPLFLSCTIALALSGSAVFTYISASSFVLQSQFGVSEQEFSFAFAANSAGIVVLGYVNAASVRRIHPRILVLVSGTAATLAAIACTVVAGSGLGLTAILVCLFLTVVFTSVLQPNTTALGLSRHAKDAGTASAVIGTGPFLLGSAIAPLALLGGASALTMAAVMAALLLAAWLVILLRVVPLARRATD